MQRWQVSFDGTPSCVPQARHAVERALVAWGLDELTWPAALLVSELAANALLHARTPFTVALQVLPGGAARLEVSDGSAALPRARRHSAQATTGRGLRLVEDLARGWGVEPTPVGKTVWVELAPSAPGSTGEDDPGAGDDLDALLGAFPNLDDLPDLDEGAPCARAA